MTTSWGTCGNSGRDVSRFHLHVHADHRRQPEAPGLVRHDDDDEQLSTSDDPGESSGSLSARCFLRYACWSASRLLSPPIAKLLRIVLESRCCRSQHDTAEFAHLRQTTRINNAAVVAEGAVKPTPLRSEEPRQVAWVGRPRRERGVLLFLLGLPLGDHLLQVLAVGLPPRVSGPPRWAYLNSRSPLAMSPPYHPRCASHPPASSVSPVLLRSMLYSASLLAITRISFVRASRSEALLPNTGWCEPLRHPSQPGLWRGAVPRARIPPGRAGDPLPVWSLSKCDAQIRWGRAGLGPAAGHPFAQLVWAWSGAVAARGVNQVGDHAG